MKVLLIEPPISPFDVPTGTFGLPPPYHLERLAGYILEENNVCILDMRIEDKLDETLGGFQPDLVGISCVAANCSFAKEILKKVKKFNRSILTLIGGHHPSLDPQDCAEPYIDYVIIGEGEETLQEIVRMGKDVSKRHLVAGIAYLDSLGVYKTTPRRPLLNMENLPLPARHLTENYRRRNLYYRASWRPVDLIISSRGCPFRCKFCGLWKVNQGRYRMRSVSSVVQELQAIKDPYVCFVDDNTLNQTRFANSLADEIQRKGIQKTFELYGRSDTVVKNPALIEKWRKLGMKLLLIGLEGTNQEFLVNINKNISVATNKKAIDICHSLDVEIVAYLIVDPQFSKDDFRRLSEYVQENKLGHPIFTILSPFPGTDLFDEVKNGLITKRRDLFDFYHTVMPTKLPLEEFYEEFRNLYLNAYSNKAFQNAGNTKKAMLNPAMIKTNQEIMKKMSSLYSHHDRIIR